MLQLEVFIFKFGSIDRLSTSSIVVGEVTTLNHELRNDAVECASLVAKSFLSSAETTEVLGSARDNVSA